MTVHVRLFAAARDAAGAETVTLRLPDSATVSDLRSALLDQAPALHPLASTLLVAIDQQYATDDDPVPPSAEIACFPPVSGG